jgi:hypothetical protein
MVGAAGSSQTPKVDATTTPLVYNASTGTLTTVALVTSTSVQTPLLTTGANTTAGTLTGNWSLSAGSLLQSTYADLGERYHSDFPYDPGTVLMVGGDAEVTIADKSGQYKIAGIVSTNPAYVLNSTLQDSVIIALTGRTPCKVVGEIIKGDLMTISDIPGVATKVVPPSNGTVIGIALEYYNSTDVGIIEVKVDKS